MLSSTLDDGVLTYTAVGIGVITAPLLRLFQKWRHYKTSHLIIEKASPFHLKILNFPMIVFLTTFVSIGGLAASNYYLASDSVITETFVVTDVGQKRVRYDYFEYIQISNGKLNTTYNLGRDTDNSYKKGDEITAELREGFWGFYIVERITNQPQH